MIRTILSSFSLLLAISGSLMSCKDKNEPGPATTTTTTTTTTTAGSTSGSTSGTTSGTTSGIAANTLHIGNEVYPLMVSCNNSLGSFNLWGTRDTTINCMVSIYGGQPTTATTYTVVSHNSPTSGQANLNYWDTRIAAMWTAESGQLTTTVVNGKTIATWNNLPMRVHGAGPTVSTSGNMTCP